MLRCVRLCHLVWKTLIIHLEYWSIWILVIQISQENNFHWHVYNIIYKNKKGLISPTAKACHDFETTGNSWLLFVWKKQDWSFNKKPCEKTFIIDHQVDWRLQWRWLNTNNGARQICLRCTFYVIHIVTTISCFITPWYTQTCISDIKRKYDSMVLFIRSTDNKNGWMAFWYLYGMYTPEIQNKEHKKAENWHFSNFNRY